MTKPYSNHGWSVCSPSCTALISHVRAGFGYMHMDGSCLWVEQKRQNGEMICSLKGKCAWNLTWIAISAEVLRNSKAAKTNQSMNVVSREKLRVGLLRSCHGQSFRHPQHNQTDHDVSPNALFEADCNYQSRGDWTSKRAFWWQLVPGYLSLQ